MVIRKRFYKENHELKCIIGSPKSCKYNDKHVSMYLTLMSPQRLTVAVDSDSIDDLHFDLIIHICHSCTSAPSLWKYFIYLCKQMICWPILEFIPLYDIYYG